MRLYGGVDLHSNNCMAVIVDECDTVVYQKRQPNDLGAIVKALAPFQESLEGVVVESTYNWYWLVDGLMSSGYRVHLANTAAIQQYSGLKYGDDDSDARWLAHMLRLGILPEGYIYPREGRSVRDLLRKRGQLVRQRTSNVLSVQNLVARSTGRSLNGYAVKHITDETLEALFEVPELALAAQSNAAVLRCLDEQIKRLEKAVKGSVRLREEYQGLLTVSGIGPILALTIMLETGEIQRFMTVGDFASYARCVGSTRLSNNKRKGRGNTKNGNKYLHWAFIEAANFAIRYNDAVKRYYQRKAAKTCRVSALQAVAHKLARACYYIMRDKTVFEVKKAFA